MITSLSLVNRTLPMRSMSSDSETTDLPLKGLMARTKGLKEMMMLGLLRMCSLIGARMSSEIFFLIKTITSTPMRRYNLKVPFFKDLFPALNLAREYKQN